MIGNSPSFFGLPPSGRFDQRPLPERIDQFGAGGNDRKYLDEAARNPGPFVTPEYIDNMRRQQEMREHNQLLLRIWLGKDI